MKDNQFKIIWLNSLVNTHGLYKNETKYCILPYGFDHECSGFEHVACLEEAASVLSEGDCEAYLNELDFTSLETLVLSVYRHKKIFNYNI